MIKLKTLMHNGHFVDVDQLDFGIFYSDVPYVYSESTTMEDMQPTVEHLGSLRFFSILSIEHYRENLNKCELKTYFLNPEDIK